MVEQYINGMRMEKISDKRLEELGVSIVYVFGSRAEGKENSESDLDLGVVFENQPCDEEVSRLYNHVYDIFTDHFPDYSIDIIFLQKAGLELRFDAVRHGVVVYEISEDARFTFEETTMIMYADFKPLLEEFYKGILDRI